MDLIARTADGLYCSTGEFHIDPWRPVPRALITDGHADPARLGSEVYVCHIDTAAILRKRRGDVSIESAVTYVYSGAEGVLFKASKTGVC